MAILVKDDQDVGWSFPGGGVDHGENLEQALIRELSEEVSINPDKIITDYKIVDVTIGQVKDGIPRCNFHFFADLKDYEVTQTSELNDMKWMPIEELENLFIEPSAGDFTRIIKLIKSLQH